MNNVILQLEDLPDFLSGEEQQNTLHIQIHYRQTASPKEAKFSIGSKKSPLLKSSSKERGELVSPSTSGGNSPNVSSGRMVPHSPRADGRLSPTATGTRRSPRTHQVRPVSPVATTTYSSGPSPVQKSPRDLVHTTTSNLTITHARPNFSGYDDESPLEARRSSSLQELPLPSSSKEKHVEYSNSTLLRYASSMKQLVTDQPPPQMKSAYSMRHLTVPFHSSTPLPSHLSYSDRAVSQPELHTGRGGDAGALHRKDKVFLHSTKLGSLEMLQPSHPHIGGSLSSLDSGVSLNKEVLVGEEAGSTDTGTEVAVVDIYILKQVTNFYHQLKALWDDVRIVRIIIIH